VVVDCFSDVVHSPASIVNLRAAVGVFGIPNLGGKLPAAGGHLWHEQAIKYATCVPLRCNQLNALKQALVRQEQMHISVCCAIQHVLQKSHMSLYDRRVNPAGNTTASNQAMPQSTFHARLELWQHMDRQFCFGNTPSGVLDSFRGCTPGARRPRLLLLLLLLLLLPANSSNVPGTLQAPAEEALRREGAEKLEKALRNLRVLAMRPEALQLQPLELLQPLLDKASLASPRVGPRHPANQSDNAFPCCKWTHSIAVAHDAA
jgi:hypothetical protein